MGILGGLIDSRITLGASPMSPSQEAFIGKKKRWKSTHRAVRA